MIAAEAQSRIAAILGQLRMDRDEDAAAMAIWLNDRLREMLPIVPDYARHCIDPSFPCGAAKRVFIRRRIPSQNQSTYSHWRDYAKEKKAWSLLIRVALAPRMAKPDHPMFLQIISYRKKLVDFANLVGGAKPIPDILQELNWLRDDSPQWVKIDYRQHQVPTAEECTELRILNQITTAS